MTSRLKTNNMTPEKYTLREHSQSIQSNFVKHPLRIGTLNSTSELPMIPIPKQYAQNDFSHAESAMTIEKKSKPYKHLSPKTYEAIPLTSSGTPIFSIANKYITLQVQGKIKRTDLNKEEIFLKNAIYRDLSNNLIFAKRDDKTKRKIDSKLTRIDWKIKLIKFKKNESNLQFHLALKLFNYSKEWSSSIQQVSFDLFLHTYPLIKGMIFINNLSDCNIENKIREAQSKNNLKVNSLAWRIRAQAWLQNYKPHETPLTISSYVLPSQKRKAEGPTSNPRPTKRLSSATQYSIDVNPSHTAEIADLLRLAEAAIWKEKQELREFLLQKVSTKASSESIAVNRSPIVYR